MEKGIDHIGVTIVYFCHDGRGNVLMARRSANCRDEQGRWDIGGGAMEHGDTVEETLSREIREEYCTEVLDSEFLGYRDVHRQVNGRPSHWIALDFKVLVDAAKVKIGEPHKFDDIKWFPFSQLPQDCHSQFPAFLSQYSSKLK